MKTKLPTRVSEAEFLSWPESMNKIELIDGDVVRSPAASYGHQEVLCRIVGALRQWAQGQRITVGQSPCDIRFAPGRVLQPDAFVILERIPLATHGPINRVPELCIEILSRNVRYDRIAKRLIYATAGVRELWLVDRAGVVERWTGEGLRHSEDVTTILRTPLLAGFELDVAKLVADE